MTPFLDIHPQEYKLICLRAYGFGLIGTSLTLYGVVLVHLISLQRRHNGCGSVSNYQPHHCLLNRLFRRRSKKISKLRVTGLCAGNSPETGEFPAQMASNAANVSIWWRHHVIKDPNSTIPLVLGQYLIRTVVLISLILSASITGSFTYGRFVSKLSHSIFYIGGLMQQKRNSGASFCIKPSLYMNFVVLLVLLLCL